MALKKFEKKKNPAAGFASAEKMSSVALGSAADIAPERQEMIPVQLIAFHEENDYREIECTQEDLERLADAINKQGFLGSLIVTERPSRDPEQAGKRYVLLSGERRLRAVGLLMQRGDEYKTRFAALPCTVKSGFSADPKRRMAEEMLILDSANLNTRGGIGGIKDKKFVTRVRRRYMENLMFLYGMSELEAGKRLKEDSGHTDDRSIDRDRQLFAQLLPELYQFIYFEENDLSKNDSIRLSSLSAAEQAALLKALRALQAKKEVLGEKYDQFFRMLRRDALACTELPEGTERLDEVKRVAEKAETAVVLQCRPAPDTQKTAHAPLAEERSRVCLKELEKAEKALRKLGNSPKDIAAMRLYEGRRAWAYPSLAEKLQVIERLAQDLLKELGRE